MRERGTILFWDVAKKFGFVVPSSGGDKSDNVFIGSAELARSGVYSLNSGDYIGFVRGLRSGRSAEVTNIRLLGAEAADYQMFREGRYQGRAELRWGVSPASNDADVYLGRKELLRSDI